MYLNRIKVVKKLKSKFINKLLPLKKPEAVLLDSMEIDLKLINMMQIDNLAIPEAQINEQSYLLFSEIKDSEIDRETSEKFTEYLLDDSFHVKIESFSVMLNKPLKAGKQYVEDKHKENVPPLFLKNDDNTSLHVPKNDSCLSNGQRQIKNHTKTQLFDLILLILYPPLGDNFDNPLVFPPGFQLYPFQKEGVRFLVEHERALLGDEMGLGKSIQAIVALRVLFRMGKISNGIIICPKSVLTDWEKKLSDWAPELKILKIHGSQVQRHIFWKVYAHLYLTTYETIRQDMDVARKNFDLVILDEIQKIKNPSAGLTKAVREIDGKIRWGLSGTPLENRLEELISIFAYIKPGLLRYDDANDPLKVKKSIKPYFLRRRKNDALPKLPKKVYEEVWLDLTPSQRKAYDKAEKEGIVMLNEQGDAITVHHIWALITKLKQICNLDPVSKESCKLDFILEKLEEISEQKEKAIIFSQYPEKTLKLLEPLFKKYNPLVYHGGLSSSQRDEIIKKFQEEDENKVLLMSVKAGGLGLTLTRANYVFHFDLWWNPSVSIQAEDRTHRIGQKRTVFVKYLFTINTIEERIQNLLKKKLMLFKEVIDDLSDVKLSKILTEEELFSLFGIKRKRDNKKIN